MSDTQKAEQEISTIFSLVTIGGVMIPAILAFFIAKISAVTVWLLDQGVLERSNRVILSFNDGIGLDLGRILIILGILLLLVVISLQLLKMHLLSFKHLA